MRQHLSVLMLAARSTIYKVLGLFVVMAAAQSAMFYFALQKMLGGEPLGLEHLMSQSRITIVAGVCFLLLCALLSLTGCEIGGSKLRYTLQRLSVGEKTIFFWWAIYNAICFLLFWVVQLIIVLLLSRLYVARMDAAFVSGQTILLAFYRNSFMHSLLPLAETSRFIRNASFAIGLGINAAYLSYCQRRGKKGTGIVALPMLVTVNFSKPMGNFGSDLLLSFTALSFTAAIMIGVWKGRGSEDES